MTESKTTKKELLASVIALILCISMLIATTFAWFTDTASTSVNTIQSGTLKVGLEMYDTTTSQWVDAEGETLSFKKAADGAAQDVLWEPGCTYELPAIRVVNEGNLAFKYQLVVSGAVGDTKLLEAIEFTVEDSSGTETELTDIEGIILPEGKTPAEGNESTEKVQYSDENGITIKGHMKEEAGNEYQGLSVSGISVTVYATQYTYEYDSYTKMYDEQAEGIATSSPFTNYVSVTEEVSTGSETVIKDDEDNPTIKATIPEGSTTATSLTLIKKPTANPDSVEIEIGESALTTDVKIINTATKEVISATEGKYFTIDIMLGQVDLQEFYHKGVKLTKKSSKEELTNTGLYYYDFSSGVVTFTTDSFSTFTAVFKFSGGNGTEAYPYLIGNTNDWNGINLETQSADKHYKQIADITAPTYVDEFAGTYDGGGYTLKAGYTFVDKTNVYLFGSICDHASFKNINVQMNGTAVSLLLTADDGTDYGADFDTITFNGEADRVNRGNFGFVVINPLHTYGKGDGETIVYNFTNITNNVSIENEGSCTGVFIGSGPCFEIATTLNFTNCVNNGNITGTAYVGYLYGNPTYVKHSSTYLIDVTSEHIKVSNCKNTGTLHAVSTNGLAAFALKINALNETYQGTVGGTYISGPGVLKDASIAVHQDDTSFSVSGAPEENYTYKLTFSVGSSYHTVDGEAWTDADLTILSNNKNKADGKVWNISNGTKYFCDLTAASEASGGHNTIKALDKRTAKTQGFDVDSLNFTDNYALVVKDGTTYLVIDRGDNYYINSSVSLQVYAYDSSSKLVGVKSVS